jgi:hypothetical protein
MASEDAKEAEQERKKTKGKAKAVVVKVGKLARGFVGGL